MGQMHFEGAPFGWDFAQAWFFRLGDKLGIKGKGWICISLVFAVWLFTLHKQPRVDTWWEWSGLIATSILLICAYWACVLLGAVALDLLVFPLAGKSQCLHWVVTNEHPMGCIMVFDYDGKSPYPVPEGYDNEPFLLMRHGWFRHSLIIGRAGVAEDTTVRYYSNPEKRLVVGPVKCSIIGGRLDEMLRLIAHNEVGYNYGGRLVDGSKAEEENHELKLRVKQLERGEVLSGMSNDVSAVVQGIAQDKTRRPNQALARVRRLLEAVFKRNGLRLLEHPSLAENLKDLEALAASSEQANV